LNRMRSPMKKLLYFWLFTLIATFGNAQIVVNNGYTPTQLVTNYLVGSGVTVSNITFVGNPVQIGYFDGTGSNIGLTSGIVMSSGYITDIVPPNQPNTGQFGLPGDPDLLATAQSVTSNPSAGSITSTNDAAILEFDFIPSGDSVNFNFVFASEEYLTYVNTVFNDAFGFYLSGPNPAGGTYSVQNLALVPGTNEPITISTIHPGLHPEYYIGTPTGHSFNGFTIPIAIKFAVVCGQTYHFKFAVADCQDSYLDTGVFLEGGSFSSSGVDVAVATVSGDTAVYEGCTEADFIFSRPSWQTATTMTVDFDVTGNATAGTDYNTLTSPITFPIGEDTVILHLIPTDDNVSEGPEVITITAYSVNECGDTVATVGQLWILDEPVLDILEQDTILQCKDDSVLVTAIPVGGIGTVTLSWSNGATGSPAYVSGDLFGDVDYLVTMTDQCNNTFTDTLTVSIIQTLAIDTLMSGPSTCEPTGWVSAMITGASGVPLYEWTGPGQNSPNSIDATVWENLSSGWYYFTVQDNICTDFDSVFVDILNPPNAQLSISPDNGCGPLQVSMTNSSENADSYHWDFGNGQQLDINTTDAQSQTYETSTNIQLIAYQGTLCSDTTYATVIVGTCGCTDPTALNYNPLATVDNGNCQYATPTVEAPNVFTPNGDGSNDLFFLNVSNATSVKLVILNRWGNVMFEMEGVNPAWNGKTDNGIPVSQGVYFYKYTVNGFNDQKLEGHGFVELIR
jgi:gliding motility-associated-like protein